MKKIVFLIFMCFSILSFSNDIDIKISENSINSLLKAIGPITNQEKIKILDTETTMAYSIKDLTVLFSNGKIKVSGNLKVNLNETKLEAPVGGEFKPTVNKDGDLSLEFSKIDIKGLEFLKLDKLIKKGLNIPLGSSGLKPITIKISKDEKKEIYPKITNSNIIVKGKYIELAGDIVFSDKKPPKK